MFNLWFLHVGFIITSRSTYSCFMIICVTVNKNYYLNLRGSKGIETMLLISPLADQF